MIEWETYVPYQTRECKFDKKEYDRARYLRLKKHKE